ncbi:hypothetical protein ARAM_000355 [Aspergillus rambellii]|uniref:Domain of unknown function at the cortex 1 domain-containing protein n=1 Tax=Aspergillus rambellii TaxID=308745 RepID=A0A0F8V4W1_9EURO|nr:hypothetical protein ARAM_000355 [Aspergillus rambellii]
MSESKQAAASKYRLQVTAGSDYNPTTHRIVRVNTPETLVIENEHACTRLSVRIQNYTGYPCTSPKTTPYFSHPLHRKDQYSISFAIVFTDPVNGNDLLFGNDFDRPIRDRLPLGFGAALRLVQWTIDPSLDGDPYADRPYLYSPALATWNQFRIGDGNANENENENENGDLPDDIHHGYIVEEGGDGTGLDIRQRQGIPGDVEGRRGHFQREETRKRFVFEAGRVYYVDFGNRYLDFNDFTLRLPGFKINALNYIDEKTHSLRYVLKNRGTGQVYLVVVFTLVLLSDTEEEEGEGEGEGEQDTEQVG